MMMRHVIRLTWLSVGFACATALVAQDTGLIRGTVVDGDGVPLSLARVSAKPLDGRAKGSLIRSVETDATGHYVLDRLAWGKYKVFAQKEDAYYPDMHWSFYSGDQLLTAEVTAANPAAELQIRLGPKGASVVGTIKNAVTGAPIKAGFKLVRAASPDKWISTSMAAEYRVLLPPSTDVLLEVSAPDFKTWNPGHPLRLESGAELRLDIALQPAHDPSLHPSRFLVPEGYVGWLLLEYNVKDAEAAMMAGETPTFRFPTTGLLATSSAGPTRGADDQYFYYSPDGSLREIPQNYTGGKGTIWGQYEGSRNGAMSQFGFFVGSEEQFKKYESRATHPGPISKP